MRARTYWLMAALAVAIVGCAGTMNGWTPQASLGGGSAPVAQNAMHPNDCGGHDAKHANDGWHCDGPTLIAPLSFDGSAFSIVNAKCGDVDIDDAPIYFATSSGQLNVSAASLSPVCAPMTGKDHHKGGPTPAPQPQALYIVALQVCNGHGHGYGHDAKHANDGWCGGDRAVHADARMPHDGGCNGGGDAKHANDGGWTCNFVQIEGAPNLTDNPWNFAPMSPGLTTNNGAGYAFFVAEMAAPVATPSPVPSLATDGVYGLVSPMSFDGTNFTTVGGVIDCTQTTVASAPVYTAPTSGLVNLPAATLTIAPTCLVTPSLGQLYILAVPVAGQSGNSASAYVLGGPTDPTTSPWVFNQSAGNFSEVAGGQYAFFIGYLAGK